MGDGARPLLVARDDAAHSALLAELAGAGWHVTDDGTTANPSVCVVHEVRTRQDAEAVMVDALAGAGILVRAHAAGPVDDLCDDLAGLGPVLDVDAHTAVRLDIATWRLVHALAHGATLKTAARTVHLSTRTASRRLDEACRAVGAGSRATLLRDLMSPARVPPARIDPNGPRRPRRSASTETVSGRWRPASG